MVAEEIIEHFKLTEHPEGGYFKETYRSSITIKPENLNQKFDGNRNLCTGILFLLTSQKFSAFHKIKQDEVWHFYKGSTLKLHMISPEGDYTFKLIGTNFDLGEIPQFTVPAYWYFAAEVIAPKSFCFVGCTVSPGFDFRDFTLPSFQELSEEFPEHKSIIKSLTHH